MPIDSNILLRGIVPDAVGSARKGFELGQTIRNAPLLREQNQQKIEQNKQIIQENRAKQGQSLALATYQLLGDTPLTGDNYLSTAQQLKRLGHPLDEDDMVDSMENIRDFEQIRQSGKSAFVQSKGGLGTGERFFNNLTSDLTDEEKDQARRIELGLSPRAGTITGTERIVGDEDLSDRVVTFEGDKAGAKEEATLEAQLEIAPMIADAKAQSAVVGADRGDDIVKLKFLDANMPNIETTVNKLNDLNEIATYTKGGLIVDEGFRQLGWKVPEGATARAQAKSLINTTILPLLKPTFGAAFTEQEGEKLLLTWGDDKASPEEKKMALEGMMMSVRLQGETLRRKLGKKAPEQAQGDQVETTQRDRSAATLMTDANGNKAYVYEDGFVEEVQ